MKPFRPPSMRRVVIVVPSLFTLFNLFFGMWSMVLASRGEFYRAGWYIFFAGVLDALDGRVARLSRTGTRFGAELDSLVDVVSFGAAPAFLIYQLEFARGRDRFVEPGAIGDGEFVTGKPFALAEFTFPECHMLLEHRIDQRGQRLVGDLAHHRTQQRRRTLWHHREQ